MMSYVECSKDTTKEHLVLIKELSKVVNYKINTKNQLHYYMLTMNYVKMKLRNKYLIHFMHCFFILSYRETA
jgi:hypothetical protein